jgi:serine/threonine protein kinase
MAAAHLHAVIDSFDSDTSIEPTLGRIRDPDAPDQIEEHVTSRILRSWLVGDRYELEGEISAGGMGRVYRATHRDLGRTFALKLLLEDQRERQESRERFFMEARLASALCHPNIVSVTDYGVDDLHGCYLVMEMLEGQTLRQRMREGNVPTRFAFDVLDQLTGAVRYMHARGILHGDIKPENVFLAKQEGEPRRRNIVKLLDFGLSFREKSAPESKLGGTPPYLAPERLRGAAQHPACDVFSLGALLYELLTGRPIYDGTMPQVMERSLGGELPPAPSTLAGGLDSRIDGLVMRALCRDPRQRHQTAEQFHFELRTVMSMSGLKVRKVHAVSSSAPDAWSAIESALAAAQRGDLAACRRVLEEARGSIDTFGVMRALRDDEVS